MDNDDEQIGTILNRREALRMLGAAGIALLAGCTRQEADEALSRLETPAAAAQPTKTLEAVAAELPSCIVRPESTAGPYYLDLDLLRQDITEGKAGIPLALTIRVMAVGESGCEPLPNALVEIWHCDKDGVYSGVRDRNGDSRGETWMRGGQLTDANGSATFSTIYPGWYPGRCIHIHFNVFPTSRQLFTSQIYFADSVNSEVMVREPYDKGLPNTTNDRDGIYQPQLEVTPVATSDGYAATFDLGITL